MSSLSVDTNELGRLAERMSEVATAIQTASRAAVVDAPNTAGSLLTAADQLGMLSFAIELVELGIESEIGFMTPAMFMYAVGLGNGTLDAENRVLDTSAAFDADGFLLSPPYEAPAGSYWQLVANPNSDRPDQEHAGIYQLVVGTPPPDSPGVPEQVASGLWGATGGALWDLSGVLAEGVTSIPDFLGMTGDNRDFMNLWAVFGPTIEWTNDFTGMSELFNGDLTTADAFAALNVAAILVGAKLGGISTSPTAQSINAFIDQLDTIGLNLNAAARAELQAATQRLATLRETAASIRLTPYVDANGNIIRDAGQIDLSVLRRSGRLSDEAVAHIFDGEIFLDDYGPILQGIHYVGDLGMDDLLRGVDLTDPAAVRAALNKQIVNAPWSGQLPDYLAELQQPGTSPRIQGTVSVNTKGKVILQEPSITVVLRDGQEVTISKGMFVVDDGGALSISPSNSTLWPPAMTPQEIVDLSDEAAKQAQEVLERYGKPAMMPTVAGNVTLRDYGAGLGITGEVKLEVMPGLEMTIRVGMDNTGKVITVFPK